MLITVIQVTDYPSAKKQISLSYPHADGVELRLDYLQPFDVNTVAQLRSEFNCPMILTLRKKSQGGFYEQSEEQRLQELLSLCELNPDYLDLEYDVPKSFLADIKLRHPSIKLICSYHNFNETPEDLNGIFESLQHPYFYGYKMATQANNTLDALRMLELVNSLKGYFFTGLCMGEYGQCTRILSPILGNAMNYASLDDHHSTAPGQLTLQELLTIYHYRKLNSATKIYALLGDPVHLSVGHLLHNQAMEFLNENAVYLKLRVSQNELPQLITHCRNLAFSGFSLTMPLKEAIVPLLDEIETYSEPINAINSIVNEAKKSIGFNTDGIGALQALAEKIDIAKQKIVILGAGGAARAIAYEALQQRAEVFILNRTLNKAQKLAEELGCQSYDLTYLNDLKKIGYRVIINTLPNHVYAERSISELINANRLLANVFAMDIVYQPIRTSFLQIAQQANCVCVFGYEMFIYQALLQVKRWFNPTAKQLGEIKESMTCYFLGKMYSHPV